jgi:parvulin-like peptidyl-prolyl isomerase
MGHRPAPAVNLTRMTRKASLLVALALAGLLATACGNLLDPAAGVVDGRKITTQKITRELERFESTPAYKDLVAQAEDGATDPQIEIGRQRRAFEQGVLSQLIRRAVIRPLAEEQGIEITADDVDGALDEVLQDFIPQELEEGADPREAALEAFQERIGQQGLTMPTVREILRDNETEQALRDEVSEGVTVSEDEAREFYDQNVSDYTETRAAHILVNDRSVALRLHRQLTSASPGDQATLFARLARRFSEDQGSAPRGGDLGYAGAGSFAEPFEEAMDALQEGEISEPVRTQFGIHVIRVIDRRRTPFEEASVEILDQLLVQEQEKAWEEYIRRAYREADIRVNPRYGRIDIEQLAVVDAEAGDIPGTVEPLPSPTGPPELQPGDVPQD